VEGPGEDILNLECDWGQSEKGFREKGERGLRPGGDAEFGRERGGALE